MDLFYKPMTENNSFIKGSDKLKCICLKTESGFATLQYMTQRDMYNKTLLDAILVPHSFLLLFSSTNNCCIK